MNCTPKANGSANWNAGYVKAGGSALRLTPPEKDPALKARYDAEFSHAAKLLKKREAVLNDFCEQTDRKKLVDRLQVDGYNRSVSGSVTAVIKKTITTTADGTPVTIVKKSLLNGTPDSVTQINGKNGSVSRNYYGADGKQSKQISNNNHGNPKQHPYGVHGEHAHDYQYAEDGTVSRPMRELTDQERKENEDIL